LHRKVVEIVSSQVRQRGAAATDLEARCAQEQFVQAGDGIVWVRPS
jgi:hypothetical protein